MDTGQLTKTLVDQGTRIGLQVLGAIALWIVGRWLIGVAIKIARHGMERQKVDVTLASYVVSTLTGLLNVILIISLLGAFGVQTATFAAIFAAIGFAIGTAWGGLLAHFAAGVFMVVLRPFKVGDLISAGGVLGTVVEIGPFVTKINTLDNVLTIVGNNKIFGDNIQNFTHNPFRRVDLVMQLNHDADVPAVVTTLKSRLAAIPNVMETPAPDVEILEFNLSGPKLAVRPYCHNEHYWQVYFDTNRTIREVGGAHSLNVPEQHVVVRADGLLSASNGSAITAVVGAAPGVATTR